jgi:hypothetical protein
MAECYLHNSNFYRCLHLCIEEFWKTRNQIEKKDEVLQNLPLGDTSKQDLGASEKPSALGSSSMLTSAPKLVEVMPSHTIQARPFDPLGSSSIPSLGERNQRRHARPRVKKSMKEAEDKSQLQKQDTRGFTSTLKNKSAKVIGDISDNEEDQNNIFKKELLERTKADNSIVISDSPRSTHHESTHQESPKQGTQASEAYREAVKERSEQQKHALEQEKDKSFEKVVPLKADESKPITDKDYPSTSPLISKGEFDTEKLREILKTLKNGPKGGDIDLNTIVEFRCESLGDAEILYEASKLKFPQFKKLELCNMDELIIEEDIQGANDLLGKSITCPLKYLYLGGGNYGDLNKYKNGLENILKLVTHQIFITGFTIDSDTLKTIFEQSSNVDYLVLDDCRIDLDNHFDIDPKIDFKIMQLDLYRTCKKEDNHRLNLVKLPKFVSTLSNTSLKKSLSYVHVKESAYPPKEVQQIFDAEGFNLTVEGDEERLDSMSH